MSSKTFNFDESIAYKRREFGASPETIKDKSQIPTVNLSNEPIVEINNQSKVQVAPSASSTTSNYHISEVATNATDNNRHSHKKAVAENATVKNASRAKSKEHILLNMKLKTSVDCLRMFYLINELSEKLNSPWVEIARLDFEEYGVRGGKIVDARKEGIERELFEFREIRDVSKITNKEYVRGYEYKLIVK
jgi:hypothetical protein